VAGIPRLGKLGVERAHSDDTRICRRVVLHIRGRTIVAGRGDQDNVLRQGIVNSGVLGRNRASGNGRPGLGQRVERQIDDTRAVLNRELDSVRDRERQFPGDSRIGHQRVTALQRGAHRENLGQRCDSHDSGPGSMPVTGDDAGEGRAVGTPVKTARRATGIGVIGPGNYRAHEVWLGGNHARVKDCHGNASAAAALPGSGHMKLGQPPFMIADLVSEGRRTSQRETGQGEAQGHRCFHTAG